MTDDCILWNNDDEHMSPVSSFYTLYPNVCIHLFVSWTENDRQREYNIQNNSIQHIYV